MANLAYKSFRSTGIPPSLRIKRWNEFGSETLAAMNVDPGNPEHFRACLSLIQIGRIQLSWMNTSAATCESGLGGMGSRATPSEDAFFLNIQETGVLLSRQFGPRGSLQTGRRDLSGRNPSQLWLMHGANERHLGQVARGVDSIDAPGSRIREWPHSRRWPIKRSRLVDVLRHQGCCCI